MIQSDDAPTRFTTGEQHATSFSWNGHDLRGGCGTTVRSIVDQAVFASKLMLRSPYKSIRAVQVTKMTACGPRSSPVLNGNGRLTLGNNAGDSHSIAFAYSWHAVPACATNRASAEYIIGCRQLA